MSSTPSASTITDVSLSDPTADQPPVAKWEWFFVIGIFLIGAALRFYKPELSAFTAHTARDLYRGLLLLRLEEIPLLGSELQYGGRVLGPFMYYLVLPALAISTSALSLAYYVAAMNSALLLIFWRVLRGMFGCWVAILAMALYAVFPLEIGQLRYNWNPCFMPFMLTIAMWAVWQVAVFDRKWHLLTAALFLSFGLQLHLSAAETIVACLIVLSVARFQPGWKLSGALMVLLLILFSPLIYNELSTGMSNLTNVVKAEEISRPASERYSFNPNGIWNYFYHVRLYMFEDFSKLGFTVLETIGLQGDTWIGPRKMALAKAINAFGQIQLIFWLTGFGYSLKRVIDYFRSGKTEDLIDRRKKMIPFLTILLYQLMPILVLSFFNFHTGDADTAALTPHRYFLASYPAPFITSAIGIVVVAQFLNRKLKSNWGQHITLFLVGGLFISQAIFCTLFFQVLNRSGRFIPATLNYPYISPTLDSMDRFKEALLGDFEIDANAYFNRVHSQNVVSWSFGEATMDYMITQDPRSVTNESPDPHLRWLIFSEVYNNYQLPDIPAPVLPEGAVETRRVVMGDDGFIVLEYRVEDPDEPIAPENKRMRNYYFQNPRMQYLGPNKELRERSKEQAASWTETVIEK